MASAFEYFDAKRYNLLAYVIMPDHVHVLVDPLENHMLHNTIQSWKSFTANTLQRQFGRTGSLWLNEYFDRIVRDEEEFVEKAQYILNNPAKRWPEIEDYEWVMVKGVKDAGTEARPNNR